MCAWQCQARWSPVRPCTRVAKILRQNAKIFVIMATGVGRGQVPESGPQTLFTVRISELLPTEIELWPIRLLGVLNVFTARCT